MKKIIFAFTFAFSAIISTAQNKSVEKSTFGIQTGFLGVWINNEFKINNQIALRSEFGLDSGIYSGKYNRGMGFFMTPVITLEPRYYYNLARRVSRSKIIDGNSGNFLSVMTSYHPNWFTINNDGIKVLNQISIVPTWGIRRNIGKHLNFETGIGIGYRHIFAQNRSYAKDKDEVAVNLHLRIGYRF